MSDIKQDLKNHRQVATACKSYADTEIASAKTECKNYTDAQIAASEERMKWYISETTPTTSNDNTTAYVKTVPANATRAKIKRIYGLTQKFNPTTAADDTSYMVKTMPATVYDFDVSKIDGASVKYNQLAQYGNFPDDTHVYEGYNASKSVSDNVLTLTTIDSSVTGNRYASMSINLKQNHKYLGIAWYYVPTISTANQSPTLAFAGNFEGTYYHQNIGILDSSVSSNIGKWIEVSGIVTWSNPTGRFNYNFVFDRVDELRVRQAQVFDLTDIFGAGNEPSTYGDAKAALIRIGIDTMSFNTYSEGEIHNFAWTGINVYENQFNKTLENGGYNSAGQKVTSYPTRCRNSEPFTLSAGTYTISNTGGFNVAVAGYNSSMVNTFNSGEQTSPYTFTLTNDTPIVLIQFLSNINPLTPSAVGNVMIQSSTPTTTKTIDLSTILYNGSPLFEGNSLKAVNDVKDILTPYKATKKLGYVNLGSLNWTLYDNNVFLVSRSNITNISTNLIVQLLTANYTTRNVDFGFINDKEISSVGGGGLYVGIRDTAYETASAFKTAMSGVYLVYELATPIEVSIDWSSTLRGIQGYSNGSITLQNTYNMDTANTITYNSIIKEVLNTGVRLDGANLANTALFELGAIDTSSERKGQDIARNDRMRSNYIEVKPNTQYTLKYDATNVNVFLYDENKNCTYTTVAGTIITGANTKYIRFYGWIFTENTKIMLNEGSTALSYRPYKSPVTVNFPTQASDAYSVGSVSNVRDFTTWKRGNNVNKKDMGDVVWYKATIGGYYRYTGQLEDKKGYSTDFHQKLLSRDYISSAAPIGSNNVDKAISGYSDPNVYVRDDRYDVTTEFKTANAGNPVYYEFADNSKTETDITVFNNILEVEEGDTLTFLNSENMAVPSDITYRIEVAN